MQNNLKISIGIPAFNEQENLPFLLTDLLKQKGNILEIIIISDGSTDSTVNFVKSIKDKRIKVINGQVRLGKNVRLNQLYKMFKGDILITFDADVKLDHNQVVWKISLPFIKNEKLGLVAGNAQPLPAKTLVESALNNFIAALNFMKKRINSGNNVYSVRGPILALSRSFAKKLVLPKNVPDDRFTYLFCKKLGFEFSFCEDVLVWFRSPQTVNDQLNQGSRFRKDKENLTKYFDKQFLSQEYYVPPVLRIGMFFLQILKNPIAYLVMKLMHLKILTMSQKSNIKWNTVLSTKRIIQI